MVDLAERFESVEFDDDQQDISTTLREAFAEVAERVDALLSDGREKSLVITKLEEASFWANASVARNPMD